MRSRVNKNQSLYSQIASDTESKVESHDLSHFANRLNAIDEQFGKMDVGSEVVEPNHARHLQERYQEEQEAALEEVSGLKEMDDVTIDVEGASAETLASAVDDFKTPTDRRHDEFDTFESTYLNDFLQEVKEYNVKKGYRDIDNTSTNIMKDLNLDIEINKSRTISDTDNQSPFIPEGIDDLLTQIDPLVFETDYDEPITESSVYEEVVYEDDLGATRVFTAVDHMQRFDQDEAHLEQTIAMEVQRMVDEDDVSDSLEDLIMKENTLEMDAIHDNVDEPKFEPFSEAKEIELEAVVEPEVAVEAEPVLVSKEEPVISEYLTPFGYHQSSDTKASPITNDAVIPDIKPAGSTEVQESMVEPVEESVTELEPEGEITRQLLEQTQTLQMKVIDQEKNIEEITDTMVHTNRLLNVTLSLLMLAIFVVFMLIVFSVWRNYFV